ncbi:2-dehydro-3-deoxygluconokinase [Paenibacillus algorifonticola]|uniref:2-dehydro-3-deoxygluconokinase n=1 Tax=Paenibacillus algorifonticola TaxID=684063 RepID=A0A1I2B5N6_9BACL|nr:sugar kinase [Paenibacillus algorifonticola]SFE50613.1 2-dehydro-3-deoxygluconokinase [Paenibacillus algorifonticola]
MGQASPDIITFGESMALFMPQEHKALERATTLEQGFGGAESNVAIGLSRLGSSVGWFGALGNDPFGRIILKTLRGEGVDVSRVRLSEEAPTGMMFRETVAGRMAVHYYRKHSAASRMEPEQLDEAYIQGAKLLHVTGITAALSDNCRRTVRRAIDIAKDAGVKVSFDPNLRLKLWSIEEAREVLLPFAADADYFLPGWDELMLLYSTDSYDAVKQKLLELDAVTIIKGKEDATIVLEGGEETAVPFYKAEKVIDTVGAGDGFCAGFLAGIMKGMTPVDAVKLASINGSLVVQMRGDWEALPEWSVVEQRMSDKAWVER